MKGNNILLICALLLSGCSHYVLVRDSRGTPVADAMLVVQSLSINCPQGQTDSNGKCKVDRLYVQSPVWLSITKPGYVWHYGDYPSTWPCTIVLTLAPEGYEDKVFNPFEGSMITNEYLKVFFDQKITNTFEEEFAPYRR